jgi:hypothetical protein
MSDVADVTTFHVADFAQIRTVRSSGKAIVISDRDCFA